jgi:hypothetical protein
MTFAKDDRYSVLGPSVEYLSLEAMISSFTCGLALVGNLRGMGRTFSSASTGLDVVLHLDEGQTTDTTSVAKLPAAPVVMQLDPGTHQESKNSGTLTSYR